MRLSLVGTILASIVIVLALPLAARADGPLSVYVGPQFISQSAARDIGGTTQLDVGAGYEFGPRTIVPIRATFQVDDAFGSSSSGGINVLGVGVGARLTTPLYAGVGVSLYDVNLHENAVGTGASLRRTGFGAGTSVYVGGKVFSLPGIGLAIEGSYKAIPALAGINPSSYGVGLRASL